MKGTKAHLDQRCKLFGTPTGYVRTKAVVEDCHRHLNNNKHIISIQICTMKRSTSSTHDRNIVPSRALSKRLTTCMGRRGGEQERRRGGEEEEESFPFLPFDWAIFGRALQISARSYWCSIKTWNNTATTVPLVLAPRTN